METRKGRILFTEDDPDTRDLIETVLNHEGFDVICADELGKAIELARSHHFDLYILDSWMPNGSGIEVTKHLREFDTSTPILFYSAAAYPADKKAAISSGAQGYLVKPAPIEALIAEVSRLITESHVVAPARFAGDGNR